MKSVAGIGLMLATLGGCMFGDVHTDRGPAPDEFATTATVPVTRSFATHQRAPVSSLTPAPAAPSATTMAKQQPDAPHAPVYIVLQPNEDGTPTAQIVTAGSETPITTRGETKPVTQTPKLAPPTPPSPTFGELAAPEGTTSPAVLPQLESAGPTLDLPAPLPAEPEGPVLAPIETSNNVEKATPRSAVVSPSPMGNLPSLEDITRRTLSAQSAAVTPPTMPRADELPASNPKASAANLPGAVDPAKRSTPAGEPKVDEQSLALMAGKVETAGAAIAHAPEIRVVNSKRVSMRYELSNQSSDIAHVELWCIHDGRWSKRDIHPPMNGTCSFDLDDEDLYGISLIVRGRNGSGRTPLEGDAPQVWVEVDLTKPTVRLMGVDVERTDAGRQFTICWRTADKNLAANPVSLHYAAQPNGPWKPIATRLENAGQYVWSLPADAPRQLFVRVQAADKAGNIGEAQTKSAIEDTTPTVSIQNIEAID
jgi:hypothetical protein